MSEHSVVEAKNRLSGLIDKVLAGETVVITRHGTRVAELRAFARKPVGPMTRETIAWLRAHRVTPAALDEDPVNIVSRMREEDDARLLRR
jgi:antitoxin (DNA-binding transcriptional repressor) of toxin-antitoxin stability system